MPLERVVFKAGDKAVCIAIGTGPVNDGFDDDGIAVNADQVSSMVSSCSAVSGVLIIYLGVNLQ